MAANRKPNLILFLPDQQRAGSRALVTGGVKVHAPNLNKLASESVIFERTYAHASGLHAFAVISHDGNVATHQRVHTQQRAAGSAVSRFPRANARHGLSDRLHRQMASWRGWARLRRGFKGQACSARIRALDFHRWSRGLQQFSDFKKHCAGQTERSILGSSCQQSADRVVAPKFLEKHACDFIEKHQRDPFILVVAFVEPHSPYNGPLNDVNPLDEVELDATATLPEGEDIPLRYRLMREWQQAEALLDRERLPMQLFFGITPDEYRSIKQRYLGLVTLVDQSIGAILGCLERCGLTDHTIVVHTSDHGDSLGAHRLFGKETMFEEAMRVPWLIRLPGQTRPKKISNPVSHIDFVPTLLDLLGQSNDPQCAGKSLLPLIKDATALTNNVFLEWAPNRTKVKKASRLARRRMIKRAVEESTRTLVSPDGWKLCLRDKDLNELYNLNEDPFETRNVYSDPQYAAVVSVSKPRFTDGRM